MTTQASNAANERSSRLGGLRRFAIAITILNILGHAFLGFEQSWAQPLVAVVTAYGMEIFIEALNAWSARRPPQFLGGVRNLVDFLLSAHITGLAVAMLLYANDQLLPIAFAAAVATGSKAILRVQVGNSTRHFLNPSNFGITATLLLLPWVGVAPPYHFTENLSGMGNWVLPAVIVLSGSFLNARMTHRLPLIGAWIAGFLIQAALRSVFSDSALSITLMPVTGMSFVLFTFYMVTDPASTPSKPLPQVAFGAAVATVYGILLASHLVFALFVSLTIVCALRGLSLYASALAPRLVARLGAVPAPAVASRSQDRLVWFPIRLPIRRKV